MTPDAVLNEDQKRIRFRKINQKRQMLSRRGRNSSARVPERVVEDVQVIDDTDDDDDDNDGGADNIVEVNVDEEELPYTVEDIELEPVPETQEKIIAQNNQETEMIQSRFDDEEMVSISKSEFIRGCSIVTEESSSAVQAFVNHSSDKFMTGIRSVVQSYQVSCCINFYEKTFASF